MTAASETLRQVYQRLLPHRRYPGELKEKQLNDALNSLATLKPQMEVMKIAECADRLSIFNRAPPIPHDLLVNSHHGATS